MKFIKFLILMMISTPAFADVVSLDPNYVAGQTQITTKLNNDRTALTNGVNNIRGVYAGAVQSSGQVKAQTIGEENLASDANPRYRTAEGASCNDIIASGLLPGTSASLVGTISAGVGYPDGYRVEKTSSTAHTFTASKWTDVYILSNGSMDYEVYTIGGATPAAPANSAILATVSTDPTTINTVTDLRKTNCTAGPFSAISDASQEATLGDILSKGQYVRRASHAGTNPSGFAEGSFVSWNTATTFKVTPGSLYINGKYRIVSQEVTVPTTAAAPGTEVSGLDTGTVTGGPKKYYVYAVADKSNSKNYSISYSLNGTTPAGATNYRLIGSINTDATNLFTSSDVSTVHAITGTEIIGAWVVFDGTAVAPVPAAAYNVSSITKSATGKWVVNFTTAFNSANYSCSLAHGTDDANNATSTMYVNAISSSSVTLWLYRNGVAYEDVAYVSAMCIGVQ